MANSVEDIVEASPGAGSHRAARAYAELLAEIEAVPEAELIPIKIDVMGVVATVLGALPELGALRAEMERTFKVFDFARFDRLEQYARALHHAHVLFRAASESKADLTELGAALTEARDRLLKCAELLAMDEMVDESRLKDVKKFPGYRALASDVATLVQVIRERWSLAENKVPLTLEDLDRYAESALDLVAGVGIRDQQQPSVGEAALNRQRAFTLFVRAYEDARRAMMFLRPEAADEIAPSLYAGRGGRKPNAPAESVEEVAAAAPKGAGSEAAAGTGARGNGPQPFVVNNPSGLPGTAPLV